MNHSYSWHIKHLAKIAKRQRLRAAHLKKNTLPIIHSPPLPKPQIMLPWYITTRWWQWWVRLKMWWLRIIEK